MQHRFVVKLFAAAQAMGIHTALDTNGYFGDRLTDDELETIDLVLLDIKTWDPERHRRLTGMDVGPTLEFARRLAAPRAADLASLRAGARVDGRPGGHRADRQLRRRPRQRRAGRRAALSSDGPVTSGSSSAWRTRSRTSSRRRPTPSSGRARCSGRRGSRPIDVEERPWQRLIATARRRAAAAAAWRRHRIATIDWMRGLVMVLMVIDHASMAFDGHHLAQDSAMYPEAATMALPAAEFFTRWMTHLCAPTFVFLAGTALALSVERRVRKRRGRLGNRQEHPDARRHHRAARSHDHLARIGPVDAFRC